MNKNSLEPDIISNTPRRHTIKRGISENRSTVHSSQNHRTDFSHVCRTSDNLHHRHYPTYSHYRYNHFGNSDKYSLRRDQNGCDIREDRHVSSSDQRNRGLEVYAVKTQKDNSRLLDAENNRSRLVAESDQPLNLQPSASENYMINYRYNRHNELSGQRPTTTFHVVNHGHWSSPQEMLSVTDKNENEITDCFPDTVGEDDVEEFDHEVAKDIIQTLRTIGDDLDAKMRRYNEPFPRVILDAIKSNTGRFWLMSVTQYNIVGLAIDASLALLKHISQ